MAFTFDQSLPTAKDRIRSSVGDIAAPGLRTDESILALITVYGEIEATALIAEGLASEFAQKPDSVSIPGGPSVSWRERIKLWLSLAESMRLSIAGQSAADRLSSFRPKRADLPDAPTTEYNREFYLSPDLWWYNR